MPLDVIQYAQQGLLTHAVFGQIATLTLRDQSAATEQALLDVIAELANAAKASQDAAGLVAAFDPALWGRWRQRDIPVERTVLNNSPKLRDTGGDVLLYVKAASAATAEALMQSVRERLYALAAQIDIVAAGKRSDGKVMGGRYLDGITNPNDPVSMASDILVDGEFPGACYAFTQKFLFEWSTIGAMLPDAQDAMLGRNPDGAILPQHDRNAHIHRVHVKDANGDNLKFLRQALPFGEHAGSAAREKGLMFVAFCNRQPRFESVIQHMMGERPDRPADRLMGVVQGVAGSYWYVPSASELGVPAATVDDVTEDAHWDVRSRNGYMFYNSQDYLHQMSEGKYSAGDPPGARLLSLLGRAFSHWSDGWLSRSPFPRLPHLSTLASAAELAQPVALRKGLANQKTLAGLLSHPESEIARHNGLLRIYPEELIVGIIPDFTLGRGKEVVPYLSEDETMSAWLNGQLNEWSAMGHVVPDYQTLVTLGLGGLIARVQAKLDALGPDAAGAQADFYTAALWSLQGVQGYLENWALLSDTAAASAADPDDAANMQDVAARLRRLSSAAPASFQDGVQLVFSFHCCLHLVGELTSFGRLDQILWPLLEQDQIDTGRAQEIIDCLWLKIGENAFVNRGAVTDYVTYGTTAVCGYGGNFPQGGGINQWVQQITVGGYVANGDAAPTGGANAVTMLCLKAARRIPVNAPTLSLRVYDGIPDDIMDEAARCLLAGGAHPILYQDDRLCQALQDSGPTVTPAWSRNYAADGCYEPMLAGATAFAFNNVTPMTALEQTLNQGACYGQAGPVYLRGLKQTFRSPPAGAITSFGQLQDIFLRQLEWLTAQSYSTILSGLGKLAGVCPSPLLSAVIDGCLDAGRDLTDGGARFNMIAPLCVGVSNTIDALYAIRALVFDPASAVTTLPELVDCLINDWGHDMIEPYQSELLGPADAGERGRRYRELRAIALALPKWGSGHADVDALGNWLLENLVRICVDTIRQPAPAFQPVLDGVAKNFNVADFVVTPGIGTFEGYVGDGLGCGASADGRRNGMPIASDLSPAPAPQDLPPAPAFRNIYQALQSWRGDAVEYGLSNASPVDMNIAEAFPLEQLQAFVKAYARGETGSNLITLTCADLATYQAAVNDPERYNLVRVRMGGWTEFYATMFPVHQGQHQRRQYFTPGEEGRL
ncbi:Dyp-type peroxidase [Janthinobacterium agaricidamnosum]|uniref:Dyp-type peroxidase family protein n=1 Tax=Janthinobacterium agaricidamnosum NBRC 102515 = DSM 9628 TaxID=1349767 RepID=W0VCZ1_9BURK|nr:Dyp-type peroxidase [Janthinobacterium agaricidamnosum]CDG85781.1 dyp-type peroxidase family protein [Janthinobacterium agaricidamnosum NBRC 102515 = DSM 9628]